VILVTLVVGSLAPDFTLPDQEEKSVSLADLFGKWTVLYFYPKDDTPGCTIEGVEFTARKAEFDKLGAVVYGISGDSAESHCDFIAKHGLGITLLTDKDKAMMTAYEGFRPRLLYGKSALGIVRSTVLIDPRGIVAYRWPSVKPEGHAEEVLEQLMALATPSR